MTYTDEELLDALRTFADRDIDRRDRPRCLTLTVKSRRSDGSSVPDERRGGRSWRPDHTMDGPTPSAISDELEPRTRRGGVSVREQR